MEKIWQNLWKRKKKKFATPDLEMEESDNKENADTANVIEPKEESEIAGPQKVIVKTTGMLLCNNL